MTKNKIKRDITDLKNAVSQTVCADDDSTYFPGPIHIVKSLTYRYQFKTIPEIGTDRENIYYFNSQIYERAEELIKTEAHKEYLEQWHAMLEAVKFDADKGLVSRLKSSIHSGPSVNQINEVISMIRRTTFTTEEMNPSSHIPFKNGLLSLKTRDLEPFSSNLFFTFQIEATFLIDSRVTLKDIPLFAKLLNTAFYERHIPTVLSYFAYSFFPDLPAHRVLFILGRERIGKGTSVRVLQGLMPMGSGSISLARILTSERFQFSGIEGKNLLIDSETKRRFKRGTVFEWSAFCNLFGKDNLNIEPKGKEAHDYISKAKGIFLGNLPFMPIDSPPAISRILIVKTRNERPEKDIKNLDHKILDTERDQIATLLMQILFNLIDRDFDFPGQLTDDATAEIMDQLADPVSQFIEDCTESDSESIAQVEDAYKRFLEWLKSKGIPIIARQTFVKNFSRSYPKKRIGPRGKRTYIFSECKLYEDELDIGTKNENQVGHENKNGGSLKTSLSGEENRRVQHASSNLRVMRKNDNHDNDERVGAQKLGTALLTSGALENKDSAETQSVPNLFEEKQKHTKNDVNNEELNPPNSYITQEISISEDEGKEIIQSLLNSGIHILVKDSGRSLDNKSFRIGIPKNYYDKNYQTVENKLREMNFTRINKGEFGVIFYTIKLKEEMK